MSRSPRPGLRTARRGTGADRAVAELTDRGAATHRVDSPGTKGELLEQVAAAFSFPRWTGRNWDALADALGDLSWLPPGPHALVWAEPERLAAADPEAYATAVDVLRRAADGSAGTARPLTVLLVPATQ